MHCSIIFFLFLENNSRHQRDILYSLVMKNSSSPGLWAPGIPHHAGARHAQQECVRSLGFFLIPRKLVNLFSSPE